LRKRRGFAERQRKELSRCNVRKSGVNERNKSG
jgi:hypothetical protein